MSELRVISDANFRNAHKTIEQLLEALNKYCFTRCNQSDDNGLWVATAEMRIKTEGATFKVQSEFRMPSMHAALAQLLDRVENAIKDLGK